MVVCLFCGSLWSQDSLNCREIGSWPFGPTAAVAADGQREIIFMGSGGGVYLLDISNPAQPRKLSEIRTSGVVEHLFYNNHLLYVADGYNGVEIWDVTDPVSPVKLGACNTPGEARAIAVSGN